MLPRRVTPQVEEALRRQAAVALVGPRQVGKTTLALEIGKVRDALYLDLEDSDDRNRLANPVLFLENAEDRLVILDEIHRMPELFQTLRGVIDKGRRKQTGTGRFLILGSASLDLLRQSGETLAGRIAYMAQQKRNCGEVPYKDFLIQSPREPSPVGWRFSASVPQAPNEANLGRTGTGRALDAIRARSFSAR